MRSNFPICECLVDELGDRSRIILQPREVGGRLASHAEQLAHAAGDRQSRQHWAPHGAGSVAEDVQRFATAPVLLLKAAGRQERRVAS